MAEVVVIGAGVGGLSVAIRLAASGHRVTVHEQAESVGGKLGLLERDGFRFDTGPSLLTLPELLADTLAASGAVLHDVLNLRRLDPIARYRFGDGTWFDHPTDRAAFLGAVESMAAGQGAGMGLLLDRAAAIWDASRQPFLESPLHGWHTLARQATHVGDLRTVAPWRSMRSLTRTYLSDARLVNFVDRYATYAGSDPRAAPAALLSILHAERSGGAWYVEGGLRRIGEVLTERCNHLGVTVRVASAVVGVDVENGRAVGVQLADGDSQRADVVVANADARHLYGDLLAHSVGATLAARVVGVRQSLSGFVLCLGVKGLTPAMAHHTVLFPERYDDEFDDLFGRGRVPRVVRDPAIYLSVPNDPAVAPPGHQAWFVLVNAPPHDATGMAGVDWDAPGMAEREADRLLNLMAKRGVDVRGRVLFREIRTPADLERRTRAVGGSIYGTSSNGMRAAFLRPANRSPIPGLFLVGGSSHPGGGLPLVQLSAKIVADMVGLA